MNLLLDTCSFLWLITNDPVFSSPAAEAFSEPSNDVFLSAVSTWEISLKYALGKLALPLPPESFVPGQRKKHAIQFLPLEEEASCYISRLPNIHNDPFDRMLICQALIHNLTILTPDTEISKYPVKTLW